MKTLLPRMEYYPGVFSVIGLSSLAPIPKYEANPTKKEIKLNVVTLEMATYEKS